MSPDRALAVLSARAIEIAGTARAMRHIASALPVPIRIEVNNLQEVVDLLRHKIRQETLHRVIHAPPPAQRARR